jgi:hypothetical protein
MGAHALLPTSKKKKCVSRQWYKDIERMDDSFQFGMCALTIHYGTCTLQVSIISVTCVWMSVFPVSLQRT